MLVIGEPYNNSRMMTTIMCETAVVEQTS